VSSTEPELDDDSPPSDDVSLDDEGSEVDEPGDEAVDEPLLLSESPEVSDPEEPWVPEDSELSLELGLVPASVTFDESSVVSPASASAGGGDVAPSSPQATTHPKAPKTSQLVRIYESCNGRRNKSTVRIRYEPPTGYDRSTERVASGRYFDKRPSAAWNNDL
jgi:hypothetical protein